MKTIAPFVVTLLFASSSLLAQTYPYQDKNLDFHSRAKDLVSRLTLEEKISQVGHRTPAVKRDEVNLPAYNYWSEGLHGVARSWFATSFSSSNVDTSIYGTLAIWQERRSLSYISIPMATLAGRLSSSRALSA